MRNVVAALSFVFLSSVVLTTAASADKMNGKGNCSGGVCASQGMKCPAGTCSKAGTPYAQDVQILLGGKLQEVARSTKVARPPTEVASWRPE
jgi:hypothetical protein